MNAEKEFLSMMGEQTAMALATINVGGVPNVRIVNFYYDPEERVLYFASFKANDKVTEIEHNHSVAFTTIPLRENEHIKAQGIATKSERTIFDLADCFCEKIPGYRRTIEYGGASLVVYEVRFREATVTLDLSQRRTLQL